MCVEEKGAEFFDNYNLTVLAMAKTRGAIRVETEFGTKLLLPYSGSENRAVFEQKLLERLTASGFFVDNYIANKEGMFVTKDEYGDSFLMKNWYNGEECNARKQEQAVAAVKNLAGLHNALTGFVTSEEALPGVTQTGLKEMFEKRTRELRRVRGFIRDKHRKGNFETVYINVFPRFYEKAEHALKQAEQEKFSGLLAKAGAEGRVCHGSYTHHNLLMTERGCATVNFEKACVGVQIADFYLFFRKLMEKTEWNQAIALELIEAYTSVREVSAEEWSYFFLLLSYPEKFWKITNNYYNGRKTWIPEKITEKLHSVCEQEKEKEAFLTQLAKRTGGCEV